MIARRCVLLWLGLGILLVTGDHADCLAQAPGPRPTSPRGSTSPATGMQAAGLPGAAEPDTAVAWLRGPRGWPTPSALAVQPDSLSFGGELTLILDFPAAGEFPADSLACSAPWWDWAAGPGQGGGLRRWWRRLWRAGQGGVSVPGDRPPAVGARLIRHARIYREGPFRVGWDGQQDTLAPVAWIQGRAPRDALPVGPTDPRGLGYDRWKIVAIVAVALVACALLAWWRRRRGRPRQSRHEPIPPPAYLNAAIQLWELHELNEGGEAEGRAFLDRLAIVLRRYLGQRFRIHAQELTAQEIPAALASLGHRGPQGAAFAELLQQADAHRYAPAPVPAETCRRMFSEAIGLIEAVRVPARFCEVPAALSVTGEQCWSKLRGLAEERAALARVVSTGGDGGA